MLKLPNTLHYYSAFSVACRLTQLAVQAEIFFMPGSASGWIFILQASGNGSVTSENELRGKYISFPILKRPQRVSLKKSTAAKFWSRGLKCIRRGQSDSSGIPWAVCI